MVLARGVAGPTSCMSLLLVLTVDSSGLPQALGGIQGGGRGGVCMSLLRMACGSLYKQRVCGLASDWLLASLASWHTHHSSSAFTRHCRWSLPYPSPASPKQSAHNCPRFCGWSVAVLPTGPGDPVPVCSGKERVWSASLAGRLHTTVESR